LEAEEEESLVPVGGRRRRGRRPKGQGPAASVEAFLHQHNGEITGGAWHTRRGRPCEIVLCIYGFPSNIAALQRRVEQRSTTSSNGCSKRPAVGSQIHKIRARLHEGEQQPLPHAEPDPDCSAATTSPSS